MYYCERCGEFFSDPAYDYEDPSPSGISLPAGYYAYYACPECGSRDIEEAKECPLCGEWMPRDKEFCEDCENKVADWLKELAESFTGDVADNKELILDLITEKFA